jgi:hypothetical protein
VKGEVDKAKRRLQNEAEKKLGDLLGGQKEEKKK